jgi:hypothetical protein
MIGCNCGDLPAHDHFMGLGPDARGVWGPIWGGEFEIGRVWVDWKEVARQLGEATATRGGAPCS